MLKASREKWSAEDERQLDAEDESQLDPEEKKQFEAALATAAEEIRAKNEAGMNAQAGASNAGSTSPIASNPDATKASPGNDPAGPLANLIAPENTDGEPAEPDVEQNPDARKTADTSGEGAPVDDGPDQPDPDALEEPDQEGSPEFPEDEHNGLRLDGAPDDGLPLDPAFFNLNVFQEALRHLLTEQEDPHAGQGGQQVSLLGAIGSKLSERLGNRSKMKQAMARKKVEELAVAMREANETFSKLRVDRIKLGYDPDWLQMLNIDEDHWTAWTRSRGVHDPMNNPALALALHEETQQRARNAARDLDFALDAALKRKDLLLEKKDRDALRSLPLDQRCEALMKHISSMKNKSADLKDLFNDLDAKGAFLLLAEGELASISRMIPYDQIKAAAFHHLDNKDIPVQIARHARREGISYNKARDVLYENNTAFRNAIDTEIGNNTVLKANQRALNDLAQHYQVTLVNISEHAEKLAKNGLINETAVEELDRAVKRQKNDLLTASAMGSFPDPQNDGFLKSIGDKFGETMSAITEVLKKFAQKLGM